MLTVIYPVIVFVSLIVKPPEDTFYPLTAHTARLLMCADLKLLSRYVERYAINYYGPLLWWNQPTFIALTWSKLIFEDMIELIIQLLFILYIEKDNTGLVLMMAISLTGSSIITSFMTIYFKQTSQLDYESLKKVKESIFNSINSGNEHGYVQSDELLGQHLVDQPSNENSEQPSNESIDQPMNQNRLREIIVNESSQSKILKICLNFGLGLVEESKHGYGSNAIVLSNRRNQYISHRPSSLQLEDFDKENIDLNRRHTACASHRLQNNRQDTLRYFYLKKFLPVFMYP